MEASKVSKFSYQSDRDRELHTAQGLDRLHHRPPAPSFDRCLEFTLKTLKAILVLGDRSDVFLEDDLLGRGRTSDLGEPAEVGRAPTGAALVADILTEQKGFEAVLGGLEIEYGILVSAA